MGGQALESGLSFTAHSNTRSSIALTWFIPVLSLSRRVTSYEVQMCPNRSKFSFTHHVTYPKHNLYFFYIFVDTDVF